MFYDIEQAIEACEEEPSLVFVAIKNNYRDVYEKVLEKENFNFNMVDLDGNNVLMKLLKKVGTNKNVYKLFYLFSYRSMYSFNNC